MAQADIKALLPQTDPFLFVDELLAADQVEIIGLKTYDESFPYYLTISPQQKIVPRVILIESLVQCGGAGLAKSGLTQKSLWGLASIEKARFRGHVEPGTTVKMVVKNVKISNRILKQTGVSFCKEKPILYAAWFCLRF